MGLRKLKGDWYSSDLLDAKLHLLDHQTHHGGNDVIALVTSFLLIQLVLLALALSGYAFFLIFVLDKLADADFTGPDADAFIYTVVEAMDEGSHAWPEPVLKAVLAFCVVILVLPAWRIWILRTALQAQKEGGMDSIMNW